MHVCNYPMCTHTYAHNLVYILFLPFLLQAYCISHCDFFIFCILNTLIFGNLHLQNIFGNKHNFWSLQKKKLLRVRGNVLFAAYPTTLPLQKQTRLWTAMNSVSHFHSCRKSTVLACSKCFLCCRQFFSFVFPVVVSSVSTAIVFSFFFFGFQYAGNDWRTRSTGSACQAV